MRRYFPSAVAIVLVALFSPGASAQDHVTVSSCPGGEKLWVPFTIDCSHLKDPQSKAHCEPFIRNQACKVFAAYRKITGINLEQNCKSIKYTIYDKDSWPHKEGDAGGMAGHCAVEYMAQYSVDGNVRMASGPYDTHELLHEYQDVLGALPYSHILFGPSQAEAMKLVGDAAGFKRAIAEMKKSTEAFEVMYQRETSKPAYDRCVLAELHTEDALYLENNDNVYQFYRKLVRSRLKDMNDRQARFNRMYDAVSGGKSRAFLLAHGCQPF